MIAYFLDGPRRRRTRELHEPPRPYICTYEVVELKLHPPSLDFADIPDPMETTTYRRFTIIGDRAYYTSEPTDDAAWDNLAGLICEDIEQDRKARAS